MSKTRKGRHTRQEIDNILLIVEPVLERLMRESKIVSYHVAGSYRRGHHVLGDIDILLILSNDQREGTVFSEMNSISDETLIEGTKKLRTVLNDVQIDFMVTSPEEEPFGLLHLTGNSWNNIKLRKKARSLGYVLNEYGLTKIVGDCARVEGIKTEQDIYHTLGMSYREPHKRG